MSYKEGQTAKLSALRIIKKDTATGKVLEEKYIIDGRVFHGALGRLIFRLKGGR